MKHLGNIAQITGDTIAPVNVIIGGSPCQGLSTAGKRAGLADERSGLFTEQIRIVKEMRKKHGTDYPRFMVWENVPGALSSNKGEDFRIVLEETARIAEADAVIPRPPKGKWKNSGCIMGDGWSIAWRILNAQFWGVPQRRRRIALVADFGGESAPEILFERKGVSGYTPQGFRPRQGTAGDFEESAGATGCVCLNDQGGGRMDVTEDVAATLRAESHGHPPCVMRAAGSAEKRPDQAVYDARGNGDGMTAPTSTGDHQNRVTDYTAICIQGNCVDRSNSANCNGKGREKDTSYTLNTVDRHAVMCMAHGQANAEILRNLSPTLNCDHEQPIVMSVHQNGDGEVGTGEVANTLDAADRHAVADCMTTGTYTQVLKEQSPTLMARDYKDPPVVNETGLECVVRRLTPTECERLQGFPDGWTDIGDYTDSNGKKKKSSDTARYKALGNSIALPPWRWVLSRLCSQYKTPAIMGSLFDGIGGFPLIWEEINGKGSCLWASEIEEFPIAVTKIRIGG